MLNKARKLAPAAHVLFADDDTDTLSLLKFTSESIGWTGEYVTTAQSIIDCINDNCANGGRCFDAIISDINYFNDSPGPHLTGISAAREVRKKLDGVPIMFASAYVNSIIREEVRRLQADIMTKPVDLDELFYCTARMIANYREIKTEVSDGYSQSSSPLQAPPVLTKIINEVRAENLSKGATHK